MLVQIQSRAESLREPAVARKCLRAFGFLLRMRGAMQRHLSRAELSLRHRFTIARGSTDTARSVILRIEHEEIEGLGEAAPSERYNETLESVEAALRNAPDQVVGRRIDPYSWDAALAGLPPAAACALDIALHDWHGKRLSVSLSTYLGIETTRALSTSLTIAIAPIADVVARARANRDFATLKLKLGQPGADDIATVAAVREVFSGAIRLDANEGWSAENAVRILGELERYDIELCEQPVRAGSPEQLRFVRERVRIPIIADEDSRNARDVVALNGAVDGINIKLVKCGGIRGALDMIRTARALKMRIMLGCMVESSICATAAAHLTPLVDYADIDGPLLISDDPYRGVTFENGRILIPTGPGLGVVPRMP